MAKRTSREWCPTLEQQMKQIRQQTVNPFPIMMAARHHQFQQQQQHQAAGSGTGQGGQQQQQHANSTTTAAHQQQQVYTVCSHCSLGLSELQVQQCHSCKAVYCSSCSVLNYDEREDRVFCLDCNESDAMQLTSCEESMYEDAGDNHPQHHFQHNNHEQHQQQQQQHMNMFGSPAGRQIVGGCSNFAMFTNSSSGSGYHLNHQQQQLSAERHNSVMRACNMAAVAAAAAADSGGSCMAAMAGISGLPQEQMTPLFAQGGLCGSGVGGASAGFGGSSACRGGNGSNSNNSNTQSVGGAVLGQWDLNRSGGVVGSGSGSPSVVQLGGVGGVGGGSGRMLPPMTPQVFAVLPFAAGC